MARQHEAAAFNGTECFAAEDTVASGSWAKVEIPSGFGATGDVVLSAVTCPPQHACGDEGWVDVLVLLSI